MASEPKPISQMLEATAIADEDLIEIVVAAETNKSIKNKKVKGSTLKTYVGGSGHTIQDDGTSQTQRLNLNFVGATVADNPGNNSTDVTIPSGSKDTWFFTKPGTVTSLVYPNKYGDISTVNGTKNYSVPYNSVVNELYVEFEVSGLVTPGDFRVTLDNTSGTTYRDISVNADGYYSSTNVLTAAPVTMTKGLSFHVYATKETPLNAVISNVIIGVILEG